MSDIANGEKLIEAHVLAYPNRLRLIRACVSEAVALTGLPSHWVHETTLAVDEACQNIILHTYKGACNQEIHLSIWRQPQTVVILLRDFGPMIHLESIQPRPLEELRPGGLGMHFIRSVMDLILFEQPADGVGNLLRLEKRIP